MSTIAVSIQTTPNESIIKFTCNAVLINGGSYEFNNIDEAKKSPLAQELFYLPFVKKVYIASNFIAIQKFDIVEWPAIQEEIREQIEAFLQNGNIVIEETTSKKQAIEVYAEVTPNPAVMKFVTSKSLTTTDIEYKNSSEASASSPFAQALFNFPFVKEVYISENFVSISKLNIAEWDEIYPELRAFIRSYLQANKPIIKAIPDAGDDLTKTIRNSAATAEKLDETSEKIISILEEYVKPAVATDGGNIAFNSYDEQSKVLSVILQGSCSGCPSSTRTLKDGIENLLKEMMPNQINQVIAING